MEAVYWHHNDHLGTPQAMTDLNGTVVWEMSQTPFGIATVNEDVDGDGLLVVNNFRFPGQYYDSETGLNYNYHRTYFPGGGRYTQSDPIGLDGGLNTFAYVGENPITNIDPFGLKVLNPNGYRISSDVLGALNKFNEFIGCEKDIIITGGDRPANSNIGAGSTSSHTKGIAADIKVSGQLHLQTANQASQSGLFGGVGWYEEGYYNSRTLAGPHVHVDLRPGTARWGYDKKDNYYKGWFPAWK